MHVENFSRRQTYDYSGIKAPHLRWHSEYDQASAIRPRVLMIEYHRRDVAQQVRRVTAREFKSLNELKNVYQTVRFMIFYNRWCTNNMVPALQEFS